MTICEDFRSIEKKFVSSTNRSSLLQGLGERYSLNNVTYLNIRGSDDPVLLTTYSAAWQNHYLERRFDLVDPVLTHGFRSHLPLDWAKIPRTCKTIVNFFGEASDFGVSDQGITIPIYDFIGARALVSLESSVCSKEWKSITKCFLPDLNYFGHLLHTAMLRTEQQGEATDCAQLSSRERQVLRWAAEGKTSWETSRILNLSERTVNFYIGNACKKLDVSNKTQAVVRAMQINALGVLGNLGTPPQIDIDLLHSGQISEISETNTICKRRSNTRPQ